ncbi:MAG: 3-dehydroquinate synthase [Gemmatimonadales bacterium]
MTAVTVTHALGFYPVHVRAGVLARAPEIVRDAVGHRHTVTITDVTVAPLLKGWRLGPLAEAPLTVPAGEAAKTREHWAALTDRLVERGLGRDGAIVAIGGGSVGDLAGFVAATYLRGVPIVQIPTTLLAMVDASVGGKVAVDLPLGKNLVGAFHPPVAVIADPDVLGSLPERDLIGGLAEAVKHGLVADAGYFDWIVSNAGAIKARDPAAIQHLVRRSVEIKAAIVGADEREAGERMILNAGHTVAHALERVSAYSLPHGQAVALGLIAEAALAERLGTAAGLVGPITTALTTLGLPVRAPAGLDATAVVAAMDTDKKNRGSEIRFSLLEAIGRAHRSGQRWTISASPNRIMEALSSVL